MRSVEIRYGVTFGKCDSSDWIEYEVDLTDEEELAYDNAVENEIPLSEVPELEAALARACRNGYMQKNSVQGWTFAFDAGRDLYRAS